MTEHFYLMKTRFQQHLRHRKMTTMLMQFEVNPFDGQKAKLYKNNPEILAMTNLIAAYQRNEILAYEKIPKSEYYLRLTKCFCYSYLHSGQNPPRHCCENPQNDPLAEALRLSVLSKHDHDGAIVDIFRFGAWSANFG
ncbi:hypothetical protein L6452_17935 [Arctium lappa]|uniref:Uncharacterized protein n=1 Tax=Arctium lappa TaxID=4217 RepID=A0ACB9C520_ARCLA|nr:hypothetical protein L6452_17935 [Arctium lappa]